MKEIDPRSAVYCQEPSEQYLKMLENCNGDPRSVAGTYALNKSVSFLARLGCVPDFEARGFRAFDDPQSILLKK